MLRPSKSSFFVKAGVLLVVANAVALGGQVAAAVTKNANFFWIQIAAFVIGVALGSRAVFAESSLLDVKRWRTFWPCNIVGYILGYILVTTIAAFFRASSTAHGTPLTLGQGTLVKASMVLPVVVGVAFAALMTAATDTRRKAWVTRKWNDLRVGRETKAQ